MSEPRLVVRKNSDTIRTERHHSALAMSLGEAPKVQGPAVVAAHAGADAFPAVAVTLEVAVLEFDPGSLGGVGDESHLDFAGLGEIGLDLPPRVDVPAEHDPGWRLVGQDPRPAALAAVHAPVIKMASGPRLEDRLGDLDAEEVVFGRLEAPEAVGEDAERPLDRLLDDDRAAHRGGSGLWVHRSSSVGCSTISL